MGQCKILLEEIIEAIEADYSVGFCLACGEEASCVEPDGHHYACENCGEERVFGAEELLLLYGDNDDIDLDP